jgi:hypothetical protein
MFSYELQGEVIDSLENIKNRYNEMSPHLDEKQRRYLLATEAKLIGRGGIKIVSLATSVSRQVIINGLKELKDPQQHTNSKIRKPGAGRPSKEKEYPELREEILKRVESSTHGDPESTILWCAKSVRTIASDLKESNYNVSHTVVGNILKDLGYSLQANKKTDEGGKNPDRNAQFEHINETSKAFIRAGQPVISIDTKKKELIGNFKNNGQEYAPKGTPIDVNVYDFLSDALCKAVPYGIYDIVRNEGWVNVGMSSDTAAFAVESIRRWWNGLGKASYPQANQLMITADGGGSNGVRVRLFKKELQQLANETGLSISVCHFPPGTSKWNKIEHRLFSFISKNWRGKPLLDLVTIVNLIGNTRTNAGLKVHCELDENNYPKGIKVSDEEMQHLTIECNDFHGEWNYKIIPQK